MIGQRGCLNSFAADHRSANRDVFGESIAREQLEYAVQSELLRMSRWGNSADDDLSLNLRDRQVPDPAVGRLANLGLHPLSQTRRCLGQIKHDGAFPDDQAIKTIRVAANLT